MIKKLGYRLLQAVIALIVLAGIIFFSLRFLAESTPSHQIYFNGNILTLDQNNTSAQAVSVRDGKIEQVGNDQKILQLKTSASQLIDLQQKTMLPGFIDAHSHFPASGLVSFSADLSPPPIGPIRSISQLLQQVEKQAQKTEKGRWVLGFGYDDSSLLEQRHPTLQELDQISISQPIYLWHSSGHMGVANSAALELLNIDSSSPNPMGGIIGRDLKTGQLNGLLQEKAALTLKDLLADYSLLDYYKIFDLAKQEYAASGITTAQSGGINGQLIKTFYWASQIGALPFRLVAFPKHDALSKQLINGSFKPASYQTNRFLVGPVKLLADGSPQGRTAYLSQPFYQNPPETPGFRGFPAIDQPILEKLIVGYHKAGFQMAVHGNGDAAIDNIIQAFGKAQQLYPADDPRLILIHAQMTRDDQLPKMKQLGITPSFFPGHTFFWGDQHYTRHMGPIRAPNMSPTGSAVKNQMRFSIHSDAPVTPIDPIRLLWASVNRTSMSGRVIGAHQRISVLQALRAMTIDAAWQVFQEDNRGSIEVGKFADLVVLSQNPLTAEDLLEVKVEQTIVGGKTIYKLD
ncbi:amidohydrolase [Pelagibaculum spongiae]|uniref:Amidohydrolase n=1 Tax=Pelagibaculum spongiae TaxID=2080658 RepID=A0A2V1GXB5_9GAMM|nr:amidohydrolase [Pelagibaculum spongiae]PVZ69638.1 amidohydrolase [Pelagibaculum spongiae]